MTIPTKTPLGHDELKSRTLKLGQRHRTILFLVDGRRPLAEVLSLAHQAGAATSHFEELVKLGLVDVPADPSPAPAAVAPDPEVAEVREVPLDAPAAVPIAALAPPQPLPPVEADAIADEVAEVGELEAVAEAAPVAEVHELDAVPEVAPVEEVHELDAVAELAAVAEVTPVAEVVEISAAQPLPPVEPAQDACPQPSPAEPGEPQPRSIASTEAGASPAALPSLEDVVAPGAPPPMLPQPQPLARARHAPKAVPVLGEDMAVDPLQQIRDLLVDTLRFDAPLFSARMFMRVRNAQSTSELIDLVWDIQEHLARARHAQRELRSLQRARELLGLGNTLVAEDSTRPPPMDD